MLNSLGPTVWHRFGVGASGSCSWCRGARNLVERMVLPVRTRSGAGTTMGSTPVAAATTSLPAPPRAAVEAFVAMAMKGPPGSRVKSYELFRAGRPPRRASAAGLRYSARRTPNTSSNATRIATSTSAIVTGSPRSWRLVTPCSRMPHGTIPSKCERSG